MKFILRSNIFLLLLDIIVICFCAAGIYSIHLKANLPFSLTTLNTQLVVDEVSIEDDDFSKDQKINSIDGIAFNNWEEVELYFDGKQIGDEVGIRIYKDGNEKLVETTLTSSYSLFDLSIISIVGLFFIVFAILVRVKAPDNRSAKLFHLASLGLAMVITMTGGNHTIGPLGYGYINRIFWLTAYSVTPVLFIHFALTFLEGNDKRIKWMLGILYSSAMINTIILSYFFFDAAFGKSIIGIRNYVFYYDTFFRVFQTACIVVAISVCIYAYKRASNLEERKRLQWLLLGFFIGPFSFVLLWILPILITGHSLIPEELVLVFLIAIPITLSIAIVKYHLMDINLLVRRSIVYSVILAAIILTYIGLSSIITLFVQDVNPAFPSILTAIAAVVALQPLKTGIKKFVDKKFFRVEYDFREEQKRFLEDIKNSLDIRSLAEKLVIHTNSLIPVDNIGFFILSKPDNRIKMIANRGWDLLKGRSIRFEEEKLKTDLSIPVAVDDKVEPGLNIESADIKVFKRWGMVLVFPVKSPTGVIHAFLALGSKKAGTRFLKDDVDLLNAVTDTAALAIDRIKLQEDLIREHLEAERLEELNELKSFFLHTITHELKTPLTSIKLFTEKLQNKTDIPPEKSDFYLEVIEGESDKLRRLIDNILDYARIEKGMKSYNQKCINLNQVVKNAVNSMKYQFMISKQTVEVITNSDEIIINADEEAIERAITNLLTNAIKYSSGESNTTVTVRKANGSTGIEVRDNGRGISNEEIKNIFEPFKRVKALESKNIEGTGLGLAIVKHIMDAHSGQIEVESESRKGSKFTLWFSLSHE